MIINDLLIHLNLFICYFVTNFSTFNISRKRIMLYICHVHFKHIIVPKHIKKNLNFAHLLPKKSDKGYIRYSYYALRILSTHVFYMLKKGCPSLCTLPMKLTNDCSSHQLGSKHPW
ncbi:uncharacterized protein PRCAT00004668001 [Priceomyces carsonii]|uniref:uncharacterized protein n=1 Tax=Priceomyces carsonii TaxID=28549 RepID=UPI002ED9EC7E|nr:unnamed protein product [Priceomyces carsonii]